jgi:hypothetical protein
MWARLDDAILDHPKIIAVGTTGFALYVAGIVYCCRNLTDGFIPKSVLPRLLTPPAEDPQFSCTISELISQQLMREREGGYEVHDFLKYNWSRAKVRRIRASARQRMRNVRGKFARTTREVRPAQSPSPYLSPSTTRASTVEVAETPKTPTVTHLVNEYRGLDGIKPTRRDGQVIAGLVKQFGAALVWQVIGDDAPSLVAADSPLLLLAARCKRAAAAMIKDRPRRRPTVDEWEARQKGAGDAH